MGMASFGQSLGQLSQQTSGSLGSSLGLGNSTLPISSPSQTVYQATYGLNSLGNYYLNLIKLYLDTYYYYYFIYISFFNDSFNTSVEKINSRNNLRNEAG